MSLITSGSTSSNKEILHVLREAVHYGYEHEHLAPFYLEIETIRPYLSLFLVDPNQELNSREKRFAQRIQSFVVEVKKGRSLPLASAEQETAILSKRELEVLQVLAAGRRNKEIGKELCISLATVKSHVINIYSKLQVSNRVEAVERGRELRLLR